MAEHDDLHDIRDLPQLARAGEEAARPLPADQVRHLDWRPWSRAMTRQHSAGMVGKRAGEVFIILLVEAGKVIGLKPGRDPQQPGQFPVKRDCVGCS